jgi:hypothetical protein
MKTVGRNEAKALYLKWDDIRRTLDASEFRPGHLITAEQHAWDAMVDYIDQYHDVDVCSCLACQTYRRATS